jgi:hypothetical protein
MATAETLRAAMALIEDESNWCREWPAMDARGESVHHDSPHATRWCAMGALRKICSDNNSEAQLPRYIVFINDILGHAAVMRCYRKAIRRAEER